MTIQLALTRQVLYIRNLYKLITIIYMYHMELHQPFLLMHLWNENKIAYLMQSWNHLGMKSIMYQTIRMCEMKYIVNFITRLFLYPMKGVILYIY